MAESRVALISRHIVLARAGHPVYGLILIQGELIVDVILADESIPVCLTQTFALLDKYADWHPADLEDFYISPGLIDCNVRANSLWETSEVRTRAAISGGVTMILEEPSIYAMDASDGQLYCDVGAVGLIETGVDLVKDSSVFALKAYLYPPSAYVGSVATTLKSVMEAAANADLPLFLDAMLPSPRMLYMSSPLHNQPLQKRFQDMDSEETQFFAAAFPDIIESSSSSSSDNDEPALFDEGPDRTYSNIDGYKVHRNVDLGPVSAIAEAPELAISTVSIQPKSFARGSSVLGFKRRNSFQKLSTIYDDLDKRIKRRVGNIENMSLLEFGSYEFDAIEEEAKPPEDIRQRKRSQSLQLRQFELVVAQDDSADSQSRESTPQETPKNQIAAEPVHEFGKFGYQERMRSNRPMGLTLGKSPKQSPSAASKDRNYLIHIANIPDHWETKGVDLITKHLKVFYIQKTPCRVHITNLSSADAMNRVRVFKESSELLTCETCPHYLYFTAESVPPGDTRLKTLPPIREKQNCELLWDLLLLKGIDVISSNHSATLKELKFQDLGSFKKALGGVNGLGFSLQAVWTKLKDRLISNLEQYLTRLAKWLSLAPAKLIGVSNLRGSIEKGKYADIVIWSPYGKSRVPKYGQNLALSPYADLNLFGNIHRVYLRGKIAYNEESFTPCGKRVRRSDFRSSSNT